VTTFDLDVMREIVSDVFAPRIVRRHGQLGADRLRDLLAALRRVYRFRSAERFGDGLTVIAHLRATALTFGNDAGRPVQANELASVLPDGGTLQVLPNGSLLAWQLTLADDDLRDLSAEAVVYVWRSGGEAFAVEQGFKAILNPNGYPSALAPPTFFLLADALTEYDAHMARHSTCYILQDAWHDVRRLLLVNQPEKIMRRSLAQHLRSTLRDHAEVREEQNVTETKPIDIKVTWSLGSHLSLIEIKWLGRSVNAAGDALAVAYSSPGRPREGAKQLANYLAENEQRAPTHNNEGHLIVFDARRKGTSRFPRGEISAEDARAFAGDIIDYDPQYETLREDFRTPRRFWLEPKLLVS
jgi:hypothetical protein